jgi:hypothetical protein
MVGVSYENTTGGQNVTGEGTGRGLDPKLSNLQKSLDRYVGPGKARVEPATPENTEGATTATENNPC